MPAKRPNLIFDLGLHKGEDTHFYLAKGFDVVAFEADPDLVNMCRDRFADEIAEGRLTIVEGAIVEDPSAESVTFYKNDSVTVWGTVDPAWKERNERSGWGSREITVPTVDFGACIEQYGVPYYIKIDVEGVDMVCLRKLGDFEERPDFVSIESSKTSLDNIRAELDILESLGYDRFKAVQQANMNRNVAPRPAREGRDIDYRLNPDSSGLFGRELPGPWLDREGVMARYRRIFLGYKVFGNDSFMRRNRVGRVVWRSVQRITKRYIPGWYDTHARHSSVRD